MACAAFFAYDLYTFRETRSAGTFGHEGTEQDDCSGRIKTQAAGGEEYLIGKPVETEHLSQDTHLQIVRRSGGFRDEKTSAPIQECPFQDTEGEPAKPQVFAPTAGLQLPKRPVLPVSHALT